MTEAKIDTSTDALIPGLQKDVNQDGTAVVVEGRKPIPDLLAMVSVSSLGGDENDPMGLLTKAWFSAYARAYAELGLTYPAKYMTVRSQLVTLLDYKFSPTNIETMLRMFWTDPKFANYDRTVSDFLKTIPKITAEIIRRKRNGH